MPVLTGRLSCCRAGYVLSSQCNLLGRLFEKFTNKRGKVQQIVNEIREKEWSRSGSDLYWQTEKKKLVLILESERKEELALQSDLDALQNDLNDDSKQHSVVSQVAENCPALLQTLTKKLRDTKDASEKIRAEMRR